MRHTNKKWLLFCLAFAVGAGTFGCGAVTDNGNIKEETEETVQEDIAFEEFPEENEIPLRDKDTLYESDDEDSVVTMYLTVRRGNEAEGTDHSWKEINSYSIYDYDDMGVDRYQVEGILQVGDETGPVPGELGYGVKTANATVQIRGQTSSKNAQKNYKIRLKDNKGTWRGQQTIALNKHQTDGLRFRNKLGFDLLKGLDQTMSLRTQFVHLYVKDETEGSGGGFEDYGLYTQVEQLNKSALRAHGLDRNGQLYKINYFEFYRYEDTVRMADDPEYDQAAFEELLEIKGDTDHSKLIRMLEDVNDYSIPITEVLEKHFNLENLTYWMAFQILTGNTDTQNRNMYLYSPQNLDTWYFLSWDMDAFFRVEENENIHWKDYGGWERGVSNYWGNVLFQRCLKSEEFRKTLDRAVTDIKEYLSAQRLQTMIQQYSETVKPYVYSLPDILNAPLTEEKYDEVAEGLPKLVDYYYENYLDSLETPLPFYIGIPEYKDGKLAVGWDVSFDFQSDDITYEAVIARDPQIQDVVASYEGIWPEMETERLEPGQYFIQVKSRDDEGHEQFAFDYYSTENGKEYGVKCFYVLEDGTIEEDIYEEG